jgi:NADH pyrophosphatase NudC (nudix superfamily)
MSGYEEAWKPYYCFCPNCGQKIHGYRENEGAIKMRCIRCSAVTVRTIMGRRHNRFDIYAPAGEVTLCVAEEPEMYGSY